MLGDISSTLARLHVSEQCSLQQASRVLSVHQQGARTPDSRARTPDSLSLASMAVVVRHTTVIEGGDLKTPWVPNRTTVVDGREFIALSRDDRRLAAFCGVNCSAAHPLRDCAWFTTLASLRRDAIAALKEQALSSADVLADNPSRAKSGDKNKGVMVQLPDFVDLDMPEVETDGVSAPARSIKVLTDGGDPKRLVSIELTEGNLSYVRAAVKQDMSSGTGVPRRRRSKAERIQPEEGGGQVFWNYQRSAPYCTFVDDDGRKRYRQMKARSKDDVGEAVRKLASVAASRGEASEA